jgi:signal transduction histidine kinase
MRMLLLELRPAALAETSLVDLLRQLSEAVIARARIPIAVDLDDDAVTAPPEVAVALYRIAQEALNNVAKHSGAGSARVVLRTSDADGREALTLRVEDDGCGFDVDDVRSGRLGLGIMAERAESIGADLSIASAPGRGTRIAVEWTA